MRLQTNTKNFLMALGLTLSLSTFAFAQAGSSSTPQNRTGAAQTTPVQSQTEQQPRTGTVETPQTGARSTGATSTAPKGDAHAGHAASGAETLVGQQDQQFMSKAAESGLMEVHLARLAQTKAVDPAVKQFGETLARDHEAANQELTKLAQGKNITLPTSMPAKHQEQADKFNRVSDQKFDQEWVKHQVQHHQKDVKEFERQSARSMDSNVKEFVDKTLPTLRAHLATAQQLQTSLKSTRSRSADSSSTTGSTSGTRSGASGNTSGSTSGNASGSTSGNTSGNPGTSGTRQGESTTTPAR